MMGKKITKQEFIGNYLDNSELLLEEFNKRRVVLPCNCDYAECQGWASVPNDPDLIKSHKELYT